MYKEWLLFNKIQSCHQCNKWQHKGMTYFFVLNLIIGEGEIWILNVWYWTENREYKEDPRERKRESNAPFLFKYPSLQSTLATYGTILLH